MPRGQYLADLSAAASVPAFGNITSVKPGEDDGSFTFVFVHPATGKADPITAIIEPSDYPSEHTFMIFASDSASASTGNALLDPPTLNGIPLAEALSLLSNFLTQRTATGGRQDPLELDSDGDYEMPDSQYQDSEDDDGENEDWVFDDEPSQQHEKSDKQTDSNRTTDTNSTSLHRARADLRRVKAAGLKVGVLGSLESACYISIACRVAKLGISEEAQDAWLLTSSDYLVLLMYFPYGYRDISYFEACDDHTARSRLSFRVGISSSYKPHSKAQAADIFNSTSKDNEKRQPVPDSTGHEIGNFREAFISRPMNELFKERFIMILKYRLGFGLSWTGAEKFYNEARGSTRQHSDFMDSAYSIPDYVTATLPPIVTDDQASNTGIAEMSIPLLAMQFLLRHFVRCTEFCLVCYTKLDSEVEAIKPYVCESPLCLYQYMALGFGPSIEHEIVTQPHVVDLLISFAYVSTSNRTLEQYPDGLGLSVPFLRGSSADTIVSPLVTYPSYAPPEPKRPKISAISNSDPGKKARLDCSKNDLIFPNDGTRCPFKEGQWIMMIPSSELGSWHCRVIETQLYPTIKVADLVILREVPSDETSTPYSPSGYQEVTAYAYDLNMNEYSHDEMCRTMTMLLDLLPSVLEMKTYLTSHPGRTLAHWNDRISPAALGILRWIIASNRSCIMQVDEYDGDNSRKKTEEKVQNMDGWLQFRFAMGAPDKEQRFINSISSTTSTKDYPTIFAWHGSPLANWHSIIREGLHFKKQSHGRAYGHGCYHAKDFHTSGGYSGMAGIAKAWPQSVLKVRQAVALSEIVNAPDQFVSKNPYYVVAQLDWIQTRYLFVQPSAEVALLESSTPTSFLRQDPSCTPTGPQGKPLALPPTAIPKSRRKEIPVEPPAPVEPTASVPAVPAKKKGRLGKLTSSALKTISGSKSETEIKTVVIDDDIDSVKTDVEDLEILFDPEPPKKEGAPSKKVAASKPRKPAEPVLPYVIGTITDLPLMPSPSYATTVATKRLQKDFRKLIATQESHKATNTLPELGWYVDPEHITRTSNLYQWIAELHSFPMTLPLAKDLQQAGFQSVVLEIRFNATYPMTPPFVRVVRPRFLPFSQGGGGHVTAGGSICAEFLTNDGWTAVSDIESVLLQVRVAIMNLEPQPARLESVVRNTRGQSSYGGRSEYGVGEAVDAYKRVCIAHGWKIPDGLDAIVRTDGNGP